MVRYQFTLSLMQRLNKRLITFPIISWARLMEILTILKQKRWQTSLRANSVDRKCIIQVNGQVLFQHSPETQHKMF